MVDCGLNKMRVAEVPRLALRPAEAARALGIGERSLWTLAAKGEIPFARLGGLRVFPITALQRWLEQKALAACPAGAVAVGGDAPEAAGEKILESA